MRRQVLTQAALVWSIGEMEPDAIEHFVRCGEIFTRNECPMPDMPEVDKKVAEIMANGGRLVM